jgi:hypothetical protein
MIDINFLLRRAMQALVAKDFAIGLMWLEVAESMARMHCSPAKHAQCVKALDLARQAAA